METGRMVLGKPFSPLFLCLSVPVCEAESATLQYLATHTSGAPVMLDGHNKAEREGIILLLSVSVVHEQNSYL